jgi:H+-transporting ATPase
MGKHASKDHASEVQGIGPSASDVSALQDLPLPELERRLGVSGEGLTSPEAEARLGQYGYNEIPEKRTNPVLDFLYYFWGPIPWMIEVAAILSAVVGHWADLAVILALLLVNAVVGFWEEYQAGNVISALEKKLAREARVKRDGAWTALGARELVPGDLIRVRNGDIVPADAKVLEGDPVEVDQSALTGESLPVTREVGESLYSGAIIRQGEVDALVYATGAGTYFGQTTRLVQETRGESHFQRAVLKIGDYLIVLAIALVIIILSAALFRGDPFLNTVEFALILTVAAIPVAMPTVLSVTMAVGARALAGKDAIVTRLASIEEMAGIDVLCSDKTGTLTRNELTLGDPFCVGGASPDDVILNAALASREEDQDPIDLAVIGGVKDPQRLTEFKLVHFEPFSPVDKRTQSELQDRDGNKSKVSKGAPQVILDLVGDSPEIREAVNQAVEEFARRGFRSLGVARADEGGEWQYLGVIPLFDPPREDSAETIKTAEEMGVQVKMITGDQIAIGKEIARQVGLGTNILDASMFSETKAHETGQLAEAIEGADGFAQVFPEHKFHIVDVLQQQGHIVGMTGDGVNDVPALKKADAGVAVSGATDAARSAADIVLLCPGLSVIVDAIKESRKSFQRMNSYATYRIAETIRVLLFMTLSILVFNFYPVTAIMIVLLALLNDGAILSIASDRVHYSDQPEAWNMPIVLGIATVLGVLGVVASFGLFYFGEQVAHLSRDMIQSLMYLKLSVAGHLTIFITRTRGPFWSHRPSRLLLGAVAGTQLVATLITVYGVFMSPIGWKWALIVWGYALAWFLVNDRVKIAAYRIFDSHRSIFARMRGGNPARAESA